MNKKIKKNTNKIKRSGKRLEINVGAEISITERRLFQIAQSCWEADPNQRPTISSIVSQIDLCLSEIQTKPSPL